MMGRLRKRAQLEETRKRALEALDSTNLEGVYSTADMESKNSSIDKAMKVILAEKLVESINTAKNYAKKSKLKRLNASAILIAAQANRW